MSVRAKELANRLEQAARALGIEIQILEARDKALELTARSAAEHKASALLLLGSPVLAASFAKIADVTTVNRLPTIALLPAFARAGGLMAYGPDAPDQYRQEGRLVGKILKGANPADLPVERPTKFYFLVNLRTAKTLGLTLPPSLLLRADEVID